MLEILLKIVKSPSKDVGAFDDLNRNQGENKVFGTSPDDKVKHFDQIMYDVCNWLNYDLSED